MRGRAARSSPPSWPRSASSPRSRTSNGRSGCRASYKGNFDLTIISHVEPLDFGIYADPNYYWGYDSQGLPRAVRPTTATSDRSRTGGSCSAIQRKLATDAVNAFLYQLPQLRSPRAKLQGLWSNTPIFVNDLSALWWSQRAGGAPCCMS